MPLEKVTEAWCRDRARELGGAFVKIVPVIKGFPDRLLILRHDIRSEAVYAFVEMKRERGGRIEPIQAHVHDWLHRMGCVAEVVHTKEEFNALVDRLCG